MATSRQNVLHAVALPDQSVTIFFLQNFAVASFIYVFAECFIQARW